MTDERQKAIDFIHAYMHPTGDDEYERKKLKYRNMAIKALEQQPSWISVEERLPEERKAVLIHCPEIKCTFTATLETLLDTQIWWSFGGDGPIQYEVVAWMPMPKYEEGE